MLLQQIPQEQFLSAAQQQGFAFFLMAILLIVGGLWIRKLTKDLKEVQSSKDKLVGESLGLITLVEHQLTENKSSQDTVASNQQEILTEIKLIKQLLEKNK